MAPPGQATRNDQAEPQPKVRKMSTGSNFSAASSAGSSAAGASHSSGSRPTTAPASQPIPTSDRAQPQSKANLVPPCAACRERKVRCSWAQSRDRCARCVKMKLHCGGPISNQAHKPRRQTSGTPPLAVSLSPRAIGSRLTVQQLSYSLSFHLIDMHLCHDLGMRYTVDTENFEDAWKTSRGKVSEMGQAHELLAHCYMLKGAQITSHKSILGPSSDTSVPEFGRFDPTAIYDQRLDLPSCGFRRQSAVSVLEEEVLDRLENLALNDQNDLAVFIFAIRATPVNARRHKLLGSALAQARKWLDEPGTPRDPNPVDSLARKANFIASEELHLSATLRLTSAVVASDSYLFGQQKDPDFYFLSDRDLCIILEQGHPDEVVNQLIDKRLFPALDQTSNEVDRVMIIPSGRPPFEAVSKAWAHLWAALAYTDALTMAMTSRPPSPPEYVANLSYVFRNIFIAEIEMVWRVASLHQLLEQTTFAGPTRDSFLVESATQLHACLRRMADRAIVVQTFEKRPERLFGLFGYLLQALTTIRIALHGDYHCLGVPQCQGLIQAMGLISYSYPDAGVIVQELRTALQRAQTPIFPVGLPLHTTSPIATPTSTATMTSFPSPNAPSPNSNSVVNTPQTAFTNQTSTFSPFVGAPVPPNLLSAGLGLMAGAGGMPTLVEIQQRQQTEQSEMARVMISGALSELFDGGEYVPVGGE